MDAAGPAPGVRKRPVAALDPQVSEGTGAKEATKEAKRSHRALPSLSSFRVVTIVRNKGAGAGHGAPSADRSLPIASDQVHDGGVASAGVAALGMLANYGSDSESETD
jgi:hypothetical protein